MKKFTLLLACLLLLTACSSKTQLTATNLMTGINKNNKTPMPIHSQREDGTNKTTEITDFSLDIFKTIYEEENTLISPLSIIYALSMTANGANEDTLTQMEEAFGADIGSLNEYLYAFQSYLPTADKYKVSLANSIWIRDEEGFIVKKDFLQTNKDYYDAKIYKAPFDDSTKDDINAWVNENTDGQIKKILDKKPPKEAVMYLINALSFDGEWMNIYQNTAVRKGEFTTQQGGKKTVDFMYSREYGYIELPNAVGFSKPYADDKYSFVALLPNEGMEISDVMDSMDGKTLMDAINSQASNPVNASIPKFTFEYDKELSETLKELGIKDAFDVDAADFTSLGTSSEGNIFISRVLHKTKIQVDERGTKAGAVTAVEAGNGSSAAPTEVKTVHLNRPFFFLIVDNQFQMPIFMGVLNDIEK